MATKLSDRAAAAVKPSAARQEIRDSEVTGLTLRITPKGAKSWALKYRHPLTRKNQSLTLGPFPDISTAAARRLARTALETKAAGQDPGELRRGNREDRERHTVAAAWADFARRHLAENLRPSSARDYRSIWRTHIEPAWGDRDVRDLDRRDVADFFDRLGDKGAGARRANIARCLSAFMGWLAKRGTIEHNPCQNVPPPVRIARRDRVLDDAEIRAYWNAAGEFSAPVSALLRTLLLMPLRLGELANLRWDEVKGDVLEIDGGRLKGGKSRTIPVPSMARAVIAELPRDGEFVFSTTGGRSGISGHSKVKARLGRSMEAELGAEPAGWRIHDLRRTGATRMRALGVAADVVHRVLGHSPSTNTFGVLSATYVHATVLEEQRAALEAWGDHVATLTADDGVVPLTGRA